MEVGIDYRGCRRRPAFAMATPCIGEMRRPRDRPTAKSPVAIPGLVIGVAYLWAWIGAPGRLSYGTIWILALAFHHALHARYGQGAFNLG